MGELAFTSSQWLMIAGFGLVLLGLLILWRTSRYDLKGAVVDSAIDLARGKRTADNPTAIEQKIRDITSEASATGKAKRAAGTVIGHVAAQILGIVALVMMAAGALLIGAAAYWG